ncbi:MAG: sigma-54-dependent Fis family transcriptional regulator, partial [Proteobacteria bacterium]
MKKSHLQLTLIDPSGHDRTLSIEPNRIYRIGRVPGEHDLVLKDLDLPNDIGTFAWKGECSGQKAAVEFRLREDAPAAALFGLQLKAFQLPLNTEIALGQSLLTFALPVESRSLPLTPPSVKAWRTKSEIGAKLLWDTKKVSATPLSVYLSGETGTGKEVIAHLVHAWSERASGPFVPINCGALPMGLVESELFGHVKGAFTGAEQTRTGAFLLAHNGTLFLDEVGNLPPEVQVKLLRFLENGEIRAVGSDRVVHSNVRLICATHLPLPKLVEEGKFRKDLYYRIASCTLKISPLRDRPEDIEMLAHSFAEEFDKALPPQTIERLKAYSWPGNVRE